MIKLNRGVEPDFLKLNKAVLWGELSLAVNKYGSYKNIPEKEKEKLVAHYRHRDVKKALVESSSGKCAFCECIPSEGGNVEVEHFLPKSIYPQSTFEWLNLLPSCRLCNGSKDDHDTGKEPILNPFDYDPDLCFKYDLLNIRPKDGPDKEMAQRTIEVCGLNTGRLRRSRADILLSLHGFSDSLGEAIENYESADTDRKKIIRKRALREAIDRVDFLAKEQEKYSAFCKHYLVACDHYNKAKRIIDL
jgi:uncharacterized protein (TIGR02646 family)